MTAALDLRHAAAAPVSAAPLAPALRLAGPGYAPVPDHPASGVRTSPLATVTVLRPPADTQAAAPIRLTRRGVAVLAFVVASIVVAFVWCAAASAPDAARGASSGVVDGHSSVTVRPGDTLWSIATSVAPHRDPRAEVVALQRANQLRSVDVVPGQVLHLP